MKVLSIIGTRPQYVKIKPIFDTFASENIDHKIIDTCQHYSYNVSGSFIEDFSLDIHKFIKAENKSPTQFISKCIDKIEKYILEVSPDVILVYGDTNSTFAASIVAYNLGIPLGHVEAGGRSLSKIPEEINRKYVDSVSDFHFCSTPKDMKNVSNPIYTGDLEYELLNTLDYKISYKDYAVLTMHRQENMNVERMKDIFKFILKLNIEVRFFMHHRVKNFIAKNKIRIPSNVKKFDSIRYFEMAKQLSECKYILTDSGGVHKCSPFYGKKTLVLRSVGMEWSETYDYYAMRYDGTKNNIEWLNNYLLKRNKNFYIDDKIMPSKIILKNIKEKYYDSSK